ncbi:MAG: lysozyme [Novosphingobium sp.]|uniref:lysozyme n=1 Tax=Novosphingobium sp. TaxID=1874826 RepID=UPI003C7DA089
MTFSLDFFDALRRMKARLPAASPQPLPVPAPPNLTAPAAAKPGVIGAQGLALIKHFESCARRRRDGSFDAYPDPGTGGDPWTIGWGSTGRGITRGTVWTQAECDLRLERDLVRYAAEVARALGDAPTSQGQFDALVSFHYNTGAIAKATLTKLHHARQFDAAAREFAKWVNAGGKPMAGLVRRREAEARLYRCSA